MSMVLSNYKTQRFIEKAKKVHSEENLDYSEVIYVNNRTPVKIIDHDIRPNGDEYGEYWQLPCNHLKGQGHPDKRALKIAKTKASSQEDIIQRFKKVHEGENLDYSQVEYVNMHTRVKIISHDLRPDGTEYGEFWQEPVVHLKGCTHPEIGKLRQIKSSTYDTLKFVELAKKVHQNDDYSYHLVDYKKSQEKICVVCNKIGSNGNPHGEFYICPDAFLQGKGCPMCGKHLSKQENEIYEYIKSFDSSVEQRNHTILDGKEIDIYVPSKHIAFEFNGLRWHTEKFGCDRNYHLNKTNKCKEQGVTLIHIFEDEYQQHKDIVLSKIRHILGYNTNLPKIYARKCTVSKIEDFNVVKNFLNTYHIQGAVGNTIAYGCYFGQELIGIMTFIKESNGCWNLNRFATNTQYVCSGIASKIFKQFITDCNPTYVKSFLDRRWCSNTDENLYTKLGFRIDSILSPDYRYTNGHGERFHKFGFRKQILHKKYGFPLTMTEAEMTKKLGYDRIWDCGLIKYVWKRGD